MDQIQKIRLKEKRKIIGLMSGTCTDGIDAVLTEITGYGLETRVKEMAFVTIPFETKLRRELLKIADGDYGGSHTLSKMNFLMGRLLADACLKVCEKAGITPNDTDLAGSHGHTVFHQPEEELYLGYPVRSTMQIGEASVICEAVGCPVFSDFRVRDMAAGGAGAPLVPYSEYLLYGEKGKHIALQNIGGIGNLTFLPGDGKMEHMLAFDTGPGNMVMDLLTELYSGGRMRYDDGGRLAGKGKISEALLNQLLADPYISRKPPKTTGRERYGSAFTKGLIKTTEDIGLSMEDTIATAAMFTAKSIVIHIKNALPEIPEKLIIGGGGSRNKTLLSFIRKCVDEERISCKVFINEEIGFNSDAKEAVAFAVLANESLMGNCNNVPSATGAVHGVVMGKLSI